MLFRKAINNCCTKQIIYLINKCYNYSVKFNLDVAIHVLTPKSASQWLMQKSYKICFLFQKECGQPYDFCRETGRVGWTNCVCIVHPRSTIFGTHILTMPIINNTK